MWLMAGLAAWWLLDNCETVVRLWISPNWRS